MTETREIAKITKTFLGFEDHRIFTFYIELSYGGGRASVSGNQSLSFNPPSHPGRTCFRANGLDMIAGVLRAAGVTNWEHLVGRTILAVCQNGLVVGLAPLPTEKGKEFYFADSKNALVDLGECDVWTGKRRTRI